MAEEKEEKLFIHPLATASENEVFIKNGEFAVDPDDIALAIMGRKYKEHLVEKMCEQVHECDFAYLITRREARRLSFQWHIKESAGAPTEFTVFALLAPNVIRPAVATIRMRQVCLMIGDGKVSVNCEEGMQFIFQFHFVRRVRPLPGEHYSKHAKCITLITGAPLSAEKWAILDGQKPPEKQLADKMKEDLDSYLSRFETLDRAQKQALQDIEQSDISDAEKEDKRQRVEDYIAHLRDKYDA